MSTPWLALILVVAMAGAVAISYLRDRGVQARVRAALAHALGVQSIRIVVRCSGGRVVLHGIGHGRIDAERAMDIAYAVDGVESVHAV